MSCANFVGVKNIMIKFTNCETGEVIGPISHKLAKSDELPKWRLNPYKLEPLPNGYTKKTSGQSEVEMSVVRDLRLSQTHYEGRSSLDIQVEYDNALIITGTSGAPTGDEKSDTHEMMLKVPFKQVDELLPPGALAA